MFSIESNPFQPGNPVPSEIFAGRDAELGQIVKCIIQTEDSNSKNVYITGERGIGKTSLGHFTKRLAEKEIKWPEFQGRPKEAFLTAYIAIQKNTSPIVAISQVIHELQQSSLLGKMKVVLKGFVDRFQEIKVASTGFSLRNSEQVSAEAILFEAQNTIRSLARTWNNQKPSPGSICIIIDELDQMSDFDGFSSFWKVLQEKLAADGCRNLMLVLIGMPEMTDGLITDHESFLRTFTPISLDRMSDGEAEQIIRRALKRGTPQKSISDEALKKILDYSENYPHLIQEIGYSAFEVSVGDVISAKNVEEGLHGTRGYVGSVVRLGELFFSRKYDEIRKSENYKKLLKVISELSGLEQRWVTRRDIISKSSQKRSSVDSSLKQLHLKKLITKNNDKFGEYRLASKMFQVYVSKIFTQK